MRMAATTDAIIHDMNIVISEFMGYYYHASKFYPKSGERGKWFKEAKYHSSWDWAMNAWRKIRETIWEHFNEFPAEFCAISNAWEQYCFIVDIEGAHDILHKAIQWYNNQSTTTND